MLKSMTDTPRGGTLTVAKVASGPVAPEVPMPPHRDCPSGRVPPFTGARGRWVLHVRF